MRRADRRRVHAATDSISSRRNKVGETVTARISKDVRDENGRVIIPAGSTARFTITALAPAENKSATQGTINLQLASITVRGQDYPIGGSSTSVEHTLRGRGVTTGDAAKVGAGAAAGAIAGRILGGKKGTVIGQPEIAALNAAGIAQIVIARLEPGDVSEDQAAGEIAAAVAGLGRLEHHARVSV